MRSFKQFTTLSLALALSLGFSACGGGGGSSNGGTNGPSVVDRGTWTSGFDLNILNKPYNCKSLESGFYYNLSCTRSKYSGKFYIFDNGSAEVIKNDGEIEDCFVQKEFIELKINDTNDTNDINGTNYSSSLGNNTWYDTSTKIYYDTDYYGESKGKMIGIVNNGFEALIQDTNAGGVSTVRLYRQYIQYTPTN